MKKIRIGWAPVVLWLLGSLVILSGFFRTYVTADAIITGVMPTNPEDLHYANHAMLTLFHVISGIIFLILGPLQFVADIRKQMPAFHRWSGRIFILSGFIFAVTAVMINFSFPPLGGPLKSLAVVTFSLVEILALGIALHAVLNRNFARHRAWMMRAFAIGLAVSVMRIFFIPYFLLYGIPSAPVIGWGMWISFLANLLVVEFILWRERLPQMAPAA